MAGRFDALLRQARLRAGMTQEQLAQRSEVGVRTIGRLETGERADPRLATVRRLADALELAPDDRARLLAAAVGSPAAADSAGPAVRNDLPGDIADFTGRAAEIDRLLAAVPADGVSQAAVVIDAIDGMAGIGKTTLAVHVAHRLVDHYPDAQLFIDLHGHAADHEATDPAAALDALLRALGVPGDQIPEGVDRRASLWRAELAERKALVVLDNAASAAQVRPLLPGAPGCLALVTSRRRLADLETARVLSLDVLPSEDAIALFEGVAGADRVAAQQDAVAELVRLCGYLPLAIRIAAARLRSRPAWTVDYLAGRLREGQRALVELATGDRSVAAAFTLSYQHLTADQQRLFRLLGLHPGQDVDLYAAAALAGLEPEATGQGLEDLVDVHLLQQPVPGRYRFHDLLCQHARHTAGETDPEPDRQAALTRLVDHYLHTAVAADRLLDPQGDPIPTGPPAPGSRPQHLADEAAALAWFDAEHATLLATHQAASDRGWHAPVWQLAWALHTFHRRRGHLHDALAVWRSGLAAAEESGDPAAHTAAHRLLGHAYAREGRHTEAVQHLQQALALAEQCGDSRAKAYTHHTLAWTWERQGADQRALEHATQALRLYRTLSLPMREAQALNAVGWYHARLGNYEQARLHCETALTLHRQHQRDGTAAMLDSLGYTLDSLGYIAHHTGQHAHARDYYQQALTLYRDLGNTYEQANTLERLGQAHHTLGDPGQAGHAWHQALELYHQQGRLREAERVQHHLDGIARP